MTQHSLYGLQKLALLDSANYDSAVIPLDEPIGLVANNNRGKTGLINALQFLFIPSKAKQNFVKYSREESQRFYFPNPWSYVLLEVLTPGGAVVMGCVGQGASHAFDYRYFAYSGELDLNDYQAASGVYVRGTDLREHMQGLGRQVFFYRREEFRERLFSRGKELGAGEPDFGIFRLAPRITPDLFQSIFSRVLRLDELDADLVKGDLVAIYSNDLPQALDFNKAWEREYEGINLKRSRLQATDTHATDIARLSELRDKRIELRTYAVHQMRAIDSALEKWDSHYQMERDVLEGKRALLRNEAEALETATDDRVKKLIRLGTEIGRVEQAQALHRELSEEFVIGGITPSEAELRERVDTLSTANHELQALIKEAEVSTLSDLEAELQRVEASIAALKGQMQDGSLKAALHDALPKPAADALTRALSPDVLALGGDRYELDAGRGLDRATPSSLLLSGLQLDVSTIAPRGHRTRDELERDVAFKQRQSVELRQRIEVARNMEARVAELEKGRKEEDRARARLVKFRQFSDLETGAASRVESLERLNATMASEEAAQAVERARIKELKSEQSSVEGALRALEQEDQSVRTLTARRMERQGRLKGMEERPQDPFLVAGWSSEISIGSLPRVMDAQDARCRSLERAEGDSSSLLDHLLGAGLGGLVVDGGREAEIEAIINYWSNLEKERELVTNEEGNATATMQNMLSELRGGLMTLEAKVKHFNKLISRQKISDLEVFKINVLHDERLVGALDTILSNAMVAEKDQTSLFASAATPGEIQRAVRVLRSQVTLDFESLFSLEFEVVKRGHPVQRHRSLQAAGSDGTTAMAKLVIGLAMLSLLRDPRRGVELRAACYLDEAAKLDNDNQAALIDMASALGFTLVMAAPTELITPRWCIPIRSEGGRNLILESDWIGLEPHDEQVDLAAFEAEAAEAS